MILVLVHGWGFDASFWRPLQEALPDIETIALDLGFAGRPHLDIPAGPVIGLGHSLGFPWLLRQRRGWAGLVSINGFTRFTRAADFPHGTPGRVLERMRTRFDQEPETVYRDFMGRLFETPSVMAGLDPAIHMSPSGGWMPGSGQGMTEQNALAAGLSWLAEWDERSALAAHAGPLLALAAADDPLVPEAMARQSFPARSLRLRSDGGHLLPMTQPDWCAAELRGLIGGLR